MSDIAIIGLALRFPGARDLDELWQLLRAEGTAVRRVPSQRWDADAWYAEERRTPDTTRSVWGGFVDDIDCFDAPFFGISRREAESMDPQQRLSLELAWKAVEDAGIRPGALAGTRTGVFMGTCNADWARYLEAHAVHTDAYFATGIGASLVANRVSFFLDLRGPSTTVDTACASSLVAVHQAVRALESGECAMALAGAVNMTWSPRLFVSFSQAGMLSPRGACRAFDEGGDGFVRAEGGAVLLLKPLAAALADGDPIHAVIKASGCSHGGRTRTLTATNPRAQAELIADVIHRAGLDASDITYIEAHGPGTPLGDPIEVMGLKMAFDALYGERVPVPGSCGLGSVKGNLGHLESAAGMAGLVKVVLAMRHRTLPATAGFETLNPRVRLEGSPFRIVDRLQPWASEGPRRAGVSAFAFGGSLAHLVLEEAPVPRAPGEVDGPVAVPLSARSPEGLDAARRQLLAFVERHLDTLSLADLAYTLQVGRDPMAERAVYEARDLAHLVEQLRRGSADAVASAQARAFLAGDEVDWAALWDVAPRRISVPTYAFARIRYWLDDEGTRPLPETSRGPAVEAPERPGADDARPLASTATPGVARLTLVPGWAPCPPPATAASPPGRRVVVGGALDGAEAIALDDGDAIAAIAARLDGDPIGAICWLSGDVRLLFRTVKAMLALGYGERPLAWRVRTVEAAALSAAAPVRPASAAVHGLLGSAANEHPTWAVTIVDVEDGAPMPPQALDAAPGVWACRGARWYQERLRPVEPTDAPAARLDGAWLLVGGGGALGRVFTERFMARGARVAWLGRSEAADVPAGVTCYRADATDPAQMARVGEEIRARYGALRGVVEMTRTLLTERLDELDEARCLEGLACPLEGVARHVPLEAGATVVAFSSIASFVKDPRQSRYAVACRVKDAWAHELARQGLRVKVMHWGYWGSVGPVARSAGFAAWMARAGMASIEPAAGMAALDLLLDGPWARLVMLATTRPDAAAALPLRDDEVVVRLPGALEPLALAVEPTPPQPVPPLTSLEREAARRLGAALARVAAPAPQYRAWMAHCRPLAAAPEGPPRWPREARLQPWVDLLEPALEALPDVLEGRRPPTEVLFPGGSTHLVEGIYRDDPVAPWYHETVSRVVEAFARASGPLRILEVGAGTASTCERVLERLAPADLREYVFTDLSPTFVRRAEARFGARLTCRVLDVERPPAAQGMAPGTFDVVIGSNVVHATRDLRQALRNIKSLLRPGGLLVLDELDRIILLNHLTFGLLPGWWRFEDPWLRLPGGPLVGADVWRDVLAEEGMPIVHEQALEGAGRRVMAGRSDGCVRAPRGAAASAGGAAAGAAPAAAPPAPVPAAPSVVSPALLTRLRDDLRQRVARCVKLPVHEILDERAFADFGLDSIAGIDLVEQLNRAWGLGLDTTVIFDHTSVSRLAAHLARLVDAQGGPPPAPAAVPGEPGSFADEPSGARAVGPYASPADHVSEGEHPVGPADEPIAVIGMAGQWPGAPDVRTLGENLMRGADVLGELPSRVFSEARWQAERARGRTPCRWGGVLEEGDCFDPLFFAISPRDAGGMSVHQRLVLQEGWRCLEDAGYDPRSLAGRAVAVYVGVEPSAFPRDSFVGSSDAIVASRLSYLLDLRGPALSINTGCSSSGVSLHLACESLRRGEVEMALAGGVHATLDEDTLVRLSEVGMLSPTGACRAFDDACDGTVLSEAVGMVCLKRLSQAVADGDAIYGVIRASGMNQDGASNGITAPNGDAQEQLVRDVWTRFGIDPSSIRYVEAHGTGTPLGDPIEVHALQRAFAHFGASHACVLGSIKTHVGHTAAAAAVSGLIAVLLAMRQRTVPGLLHFRQPNHHLQLERTPFTLGATPRPWSGTPLTAALNAFGHSGTNVHLVVGEAAAAPRPGRLRHHRAPLVFPLAAADAERLREVARRLLDHLERSDDDLLALAHTLQCGRTPMAARFAVVARDRAELRARLASFAAGTCAAPARPSGDPAVWLAEGDAERLAAWWSCGGEVAWARLYAETPRRVHLPAYPFRRDRYSVALPTAASAPLDAGADARFPQGTLTLVPEWVNASPSLLPPPSSTLHVVGARAEALSQAVRIRFEAPDAQPALAGFRLVRALLDSGRGEGPLDLTVVTRSDRPEQAALHGLLGAAAREYPQWTVRIVDLLPDAPLPADLARLPAGLWRHRDGCWQRRRLVPWTAAPGATRFRHGGVYVVAGGAGGLGRVVSRYLSERYGASLVWLGRRAPHEVDAGGALYLQADLADRAALERAYEAVRRRHPRIHGVIHSALVLADQSLAHMDESRFLEAVNPKLEGTRNLVEVFGREPLDFVLLFSAMNAFVTPPGQANYAAGCAAQDALAATLPGLVRVVSWGWWGSHGVVSGPQYRERLSRLGLASIEPEEGLAFLERLLSGPDRQVAMLKTTRPLTLDELAAPAAAPPSGGRAVREVVLEHLSHALLLDPSRIDPEASFMDYGLDSISGVAFVRALNQALDAGLTNTDLFDFCSVDRLTALLRERVGELVRTAAAPRADAPPAEEAVAIVGMSGRFTASPDVHALWRNIAAGRDLVGPVTRFPDLRGAFGALLDDIRRFDPLFFGISGAEAAWMDPQQRIFLEESWTALEHAGYAGVAAEGQACGVYLGCHEGDYQRLLGDAPPPQAFWGNSMAVTASRIAYCLNLKGPAIAVDTACSSSLVAIHLACQALRSGEIDMAVAGGVFLHSTDKFFRHAQRAGMLSASGRCATFDASADGFVFGEGAGAVVLKRLSDAMADGDTIHGVIRASAVNQDGTTNGITAPSARAQEALVAGLHARHGIDVERIALVEAHGTATRLGDPIEVEALTRAFRRATERRGFCALGSVKTNLGHASAAAGVCGLLKLLLGMAHGQLPPSLHFRDNPDIDFASSPFYVGTELRPWPADQPLAAISGFGFSGTNAHIVIERPPSVPRPVRAEGEAVVMISARTEPQLRRLVGRLAEGCAHLDIADIAWTLAAGRKHQRHRVAFRARSADDLAARMRGWLADGSGAVDDPYVRGAAPDLAALPRGRRVPLPTCPFDGGSYWVPERHPMLHRQVSADTFASTFTGQESFVADHVLDGERVLPGVAYLEMARAAAGTVRLRLADVVWLRPLVLGEAPVEVSTRLARGADGETDVRIATAAQEHARGRILADPPAETPPVDLDALRAACDQGTVEPEQCYAPFRRMGFTHGAAHQGIERVWLGRGHALARLAMPAGAAAQGLVLHPGMLDSALQVSAALMLAEGLPVTPLLPFELRALEVHAPCTDRMWVRAERRPEGRFDFDLWDAEGRLCVRMRGLTSRPLERPETLLLVPHEVPRTEVMPAPAARRVLLCGFPELGMEARRLDAHVPPDAPVERRYEQCAAALLEALKAAPSGMVQVVVAEGEPLLAGLAGMLRTARLEYGALSTQLVVAPPGPDLPALLEACAGDAADLVRCRGRQRFAEAWRELAAPSASPPWRDGGAYLVTGAGGGLGRLVARDIASRARGATLVLVGRAAPRVEGLGDARVVARAVDVSRADQVAGLFAELAREGIALDGIVHAAGVLRDRLLAGKTVDELRAVLAPKVAGLVNLDRESAAHPLSFFVLFAAGAGAFGNVGQADYAAANAFLDAYAADRNARVAAGRAHGHTLAVDWPLWRDGGMTVDDATRERLRRQLGMVPMAAEDGLDALYRGLAAGVPRMFVISGERRRIERRFLAPEASSPAPVVAPPAAVAPLSALHPGGGGRPAALLADLRGRVAALLELPQAHIDADDELLALGFDSISLTHLADRLNQAYGTRLTPTVFFEHATIGRLAGHLATLGVGSGAAPASASAAAPSASAASASVCVASVAASAASASVSSAASSWAEAAVAPTAPAADDAVAIVGMSGCFPGAADLQQLWVNLVEGRDCIREIPPERWDWREHPELPRWGGFIEGAEAFDPLFFGLSGLEAETIDPTHRLLLMHAWRAVEDAGHAPQSLAGTRTAVFFGMGPSGWDDVLADGPVEGHAAVATLAAMGPNRLSWFLDLHGPSQPIETACSSSLVAVHRAVAALREGACDAALVGGVNLMLSPRLHVSTAKSGMLSPDGRCKAFADDADGYVRGEGVGVLFLKPLRRARADGDTIHAVIRGSAENHGGRAASLTSPNPAAQAALLAEAYRRAGIDPGSVGYVEAHGTGTKLGDPIEVEALRRVFPDDRPCFLGSVKSNIGHLEVAAGVAGLVKAVLCLRHRILPRTLHCERVNAHIDLGPFRPVTETTAWEARDGQPRRAAVSSFGAGGSNAHVILEEHPQPAAGAARGLALIVLSARTPARLEAQVAQLLGVLGRFHDDDLADIAYTLQVGRDAMQHRLAVVAGSLRELSERLVSGQVMRGQVARDNPFVEAFRDDPKLRAAVASWLVDGELERVIRLWVEGLTVDWRPLHHGQRRRRLSLPGYPFASDVYTVPRVRPGGRLHPLVHRNASTLDEVCFASTFSGHEPFLADHRVEGRRVLPAAGLLEMARAAVVMAAPRAEGHVELHDVYFMRPLVVEGPTVVHVSVSRELELDVRAPGGGSYCRGRARFVPVPPSDGGLVAAPLQAVSVTSGEQAYLAMAAKGLDYGPSHRGLASMTAGRDAHGRAWVRARLAYAGGDLPQYVLHPGVLDAALQASLGLEAGDAGLRLPFSVGEMRVLGPTTGAMEVVIAARDDGRFDLDLLDAAGAPCARLRGFSSRPVVGGEIAPVMLAAVWDRVAFVEASEAPLVAGPQVDVPARATRVELRDHDMLQLLRRIKALVGTHGEQALHLTVVTRGGAAVHPDESPDAAQASLHGLAGTLAEEYPAWRVRVVDVASQGLTRLLPDEDPLAVDADFGEGRGAHLPDDGAFPVDADFGEGRSAHLPDEESFTVYAVRDGLLHRRRMARVEAPASTPRAPYRDGATYVVIGGAGGLGGVWTREVLTRCRARVVWIGRRPLDATIEARLAGLEPRPRYVAADARDPRALARVAAEIGPVHGLVLSALTLRDMPLAAMEEADLLAAWSTKAEIAASAMQVFGSHPLELVLFFSSLMAYDAHRGQANYAAGCAFETAFARAWSRRTEALVRVVHWGYWGGTGVVAGLRERMARQGVGSLEAPEAMAALDLLLGSPLPELALVRDRRWLDVTGERLAVLPVTPGADVGGDKAAGGLYPAIPSTGGLVPDAPIDEVLRAVEETLDLAPGSVDAGHDLADLGLDAVALTRLGRRLGRPLPAGLLTECSGLGDLARHLAQATPGRAGGLGPAAVSLSAGAPPAPDAAEAELDACLDALLAERLPALAPHAVPAHRRWLAEARRRAALADGRGASARWAARRDDWLALPHLRGRVALVEATLAALPEILSGRRSGPEVMFQDGSLEAVQAVYQDHPVSDWFHEVVAAEVERYVAALRQVDPSARVRILEVGAGTGATTAVVLRRLAPHRAAVAEYAFSDVSRAFLNRARERFTDPLMTFALVDVEAPLALAGFDIVIAANVLHATRDIARTLANVKGALRGGGLLLVNEISTHSTFGLLTFGLLEGWWRFDDGALRMPGGPGLSPSGWQRVLGRAGFVGARFPAAAAHGLGQQIVAASSDGVVRRPTAPRATGSAASPADAVAPRSVAATRADVVTLPSVPAAVRVEAVAPPVPAATRADAVTPTFAAAAAPPASATRPRALAWLSGRVAQVLKVPLDGLDPREPLESYGLDSIMVVQLAQAFRRELDVDATTFFEHATLDRLVDHLLATQPERLMRLVDPAAPSPVERAVAHAPAPPSLAAAVTAAPLSAAAAVAVAPAPLPVAPEAPRPAAGPVAIVGVAARFAGADDLDALWAMLSAGRSGVREVPPERWDWRAHHDPRPGVAGRCYTRWGAFMDGVDRFDPLFFRIAPAEAERMDPQQRLFLETAYACLQDAGHTPAGLGAQGPVGVFVGVMNGDYPGASFSSVANRVSFHLDLRGPSLAVDTACSSSLSALHLACESLAGGGCATAIAGGVNLIVDAVHYERLAELTMLSAGERNRAFGDGADGFVAGEGVAAVLLKPLARALADGDHVYGVILGSALNAGGRTSGYTVPSAGAQAAVVSAALARAGVHPRTVTCVEAHGTGTILGDPIEVAGLTRAFGRLTDDRGFCALGSVKSNLGHCEGAAGLAGLCKVLLQLRHRQLVPTLHAETLNPRIDFDGSPFAVQQRLAPWARPVVDVDGTVREHPRRAGLSSFGAGGANAHVVVEEAPTLPVLLPGGRAQAIVLSARTDEALREAASRLARALDGTPHRLEDIAFTLQVGREAMPRRLAFHAADVDEARGMLEAFAAGAPSAAVRCGRDGEPLDDPLAAWVGGGDVDWTGWHDGPRRRVPLPAYPFARESFWLAPRGGDDVLRGENTSDFAEQRFTYTFRGDEPVMAHHRVGGRPLLPAAAYLEMARSAVARAAGVSPARLENVAWTSPVSAPARLHLSLEPTDDAAVAFEFYTEAEGQRTLHCRGHAVLDDAAPPPARDVRWSGEPLDVEAAYAALAAQGFDYGPAHRGLLRAARVADHVLAEVAVPPAASPLHDAEGLHPSLADAALQAAHWLPSGTAGPPFALRRLELFAPPGSHAWVVARRGAAGAVDIDLCDESGRVLARLVALSGRPARRPAAPSSADGPVPYAEELLRRDHA